MAEIAAGGTLDQYGVLEIVARSGMATVFKGRDLVDGRLVALKVPHLEFEADVVFHKRFLREEEIGVRLDHPSIVRVLRPKEKSRVYLVQEFVEGESLHRLIRRESPLPIDRAVQIAVQIADALDYLHREGVVHRDLKPQNVILTPGGGIKIIDFGIAFDAALGKMTWSGLSGTTGTPDYMAPEQVEGRRGDPRSDLYSLGVILYEMLTGRVPFGGNGVAAMRAKVVSDPDPPRQFRPDIPAGLEEAILLALERDPTKRPESAFELKEMLTHPDSLVRTRRAAGAASRDRFTPRARRVLAIAVVLGGSAFLLVALWAASLLVPAEPATVGRGDTSAWNRPPR
jgi:serine/threonine-protein kinase